MLYPFCMVGRVFLVNIKKDTSFTDDFIMIDKIK